MHTFEFCNFCVSWIPGALKVRRRWKSFRHRPLRRAYFSRRCFAALKHKIWNLSLRRYSVWLRDKGSYRRMNSRHRKTTKKHAPLERRPRGVKINLDRWYRASISFPGGGVSVSLKDLPHLRLSIVCGFYMGCVIFCNSWSLQLVWVVQFNLILVWMFCRCRALPLWFLWLSLILKEGNHVLLLELLANNSQPPASFE